MKRKKRGHPNQLELALIFAPEIAPESGAESEPEMTSPTGLSIEPTIEGQTEPNTEPQIVAMRDKETNTMTTSSSAIPAGPDEAAVPEHEPIIQEARLWRDDGWTARVIKNENDDGWAVEMTKDGEAEPALVGPWTMGRDKKNPKPLDASAFATLVKTAFEVRRRHEQQLHAMLHKSVVVETDTGTVSVTLDIVPDEDNAYATLAAYDEAGTQLAQVRVAPGFKLSKASAAAWIDNDFRRPERA